MEKIKQLKVMTSLLMFVFVFTFTACSSDDDNGGNSGEVVTQSNAQLAVGTWMCVSSEDTYQGYTATGLLVGAQITIKSDGTYTSTASSFGTSGTYKFSGDTITAKNDLGDTFVVKVAINGNTMTWKGTASSGVSFSYVFTRE